MPFPVKILIVELRNLKTSVGLLPTASCYIVVISISIGWVIKSVTFVNVSWWSSSLLLLKSRAGPGAVVTGSPRQVGLWFDANHDYIVRTRPARATTNR